MRACYDWVCYDGVLERVCYERMCHESVNINNDGECWYLELLVHSLHFLGHGRDAASVHPHLKGN